MSGQEVLTKSIVLDIFRAANLLGRSGGKMAMQLGLTSVQQCLLLGAVAREGEVALKDLRHNTLVTKQNITGMIERLRQKGYVHTFVDPKDRRVTRVRLTEQGQQVLQQLEPMTQGNNEATFGDFTPDELQQLSGLLEKLVMRLNTQVEE